MTRPNLATLISGLSIAVLGTVLLLDRLDALSLDFGSMAPLALAVVGTILLAGGLARRDGA